MKADRQAETRKPVPFFFILERNIFLNKSTIRNGRSKHFSSSTITTRPRRRPLCPTRHSLPPRRNALYHHPDRHPRLRFVCDPHLHQLCDPDRCLLHPSRRPSPAHEAGEAPVTHLHPQHALPGPQLHPVHPAMSVLHRRLQRALCRLCGRLLPCAGRSVPHLNHRGRADPASRHMHRDIAHPAGARRVRDAVKHQAYTCDYHLCRRRSAGNRIPLCPHRHQRPLHHGRRGLWTLVLAAQRHQHRHDHQHLLLLHHLRLQARLGPARALEIRLKTVWSSPDYLDHGMSDFDRPRYVCFNFISFSLCHSPRYFHSAGNAKRLRRIAIFSILQYTTNVPELGSQVLTFVAIFLPLSSLWAAAAIDHKTSSSSSASAGTSARLRFMGIGQSLSRGAAGGRREGGGGGGDGEKGRGKRGKDVKSYTTNDTEKSGMSGDSEELKGYP